MKTKIFESKDTNVKKFVFEFENPKGIAEAVLYRLYCMERLTECYDNPIDACYEMILKLNELNLL